MRPVPFAVHSPRHTLPVLKLAAVVHGDRLEYSPEVFSPQLLFQHIQHGHHTCHSPVRHKKHKVRPRRSFRHGQEPLLAPALFRGHHGIHLPVKRLFPFINFFRSVLDAVPLRRSRWPYLVMLLLFLPAHWQAFVGQAEEYPGVDVLVNRPF